MSLNRIPPLSADETLKYYQNGTIPERFKPTNAEYRRQSILSHYGAPKPPTDQDDDDGQKKHSILNNYTR